MGFSCGLMTAHLANAQSQWTTTDAFQLAQGFSSLGLGMGINEFGNILAVGNGIADSSGTTVAITRQSRTLARPGQLSSLVPSTISARAHALSRLSPTRAK